MSRPAGDTKRQARERARALREEQQRAALRRERALRIGVAVAVVAVLVGAGLLWQSGRRGLDPAAALPATVTAPDGGLVFGAADAAVTLDMWADFQCPACAQWESVNAQTVAAGVRDGTVRYVVHPLTFLDDRLDNTSSAQATGVLACVITEADPAAALAFHDLVFANQPAEVAGTPAWNEDDLLGWAAQAGAEGEAVEACVAADRYAGWVANVQQSMAGAGVTGTPTLFIDGQQVEPDRFAATFDDPAALRRLIEEAAAS